MDLKMTYKVSLSSPLLAFRVQKCHFLCPFSKLIRVFFPVLDVKSGYFCMFWVDNSIIIIDHLGPFSLLSYCSRRKCIIKMLNNEQQNRCLKNIPEQVYMMPAGSPNVGRITAVTNTHHNTTYTNKYS